MITLVPSFLDGSSPFLYVAMTTVKAWMSLEFQPDPITYYRFSSPINVFKQLIQFLQCVLFTFYHKYLKDNKYF